MLQPIPQMPFVFWVCEKQNPWFGFQTDVLGWHAPVTVNITRHEYSYFLMNIHKHKAPNILGCTIWWQLDRGGLKRGHLGICLFSVALGCWGNLMGLFCVRSVKATLWTMVSLTFKGTNDVLDVIDARVYEKKSVHIFPCCTTTNTFWIQKQLPALPIIESIYACKENVYLLCQILYFLRGNYWSSLYSDLL